MYTLPSLDNMTFKKILYNDCYGGFDISVEALDLYNESSETKYYKFNIPNLHENEKLVSIVEKLGNKANGLCSKLKILKIPEFIFPYVKISEYDGLEDVEIDYNLAHAQILHEIMNNRSFSDLISNRVSINPQLIEKYNTLVMYHDYWNLHKECWNDKIPR